MPLADTSLAVADEIRKKSWQPLHRIEDVGGNVLSASQQLSDLGPNWTIYAEGDSWFDKFSPLGTDGTNLLSHIRTPFKTAVVDVSHIGDTAESMTTGQQARQTQAMFDTLKFQVILLSAGGNDLISIFQQLFAAKAMGKVPPNLWFTLDDLEHLNDPARFTHAFDDLVGRIRAFISMRDHARQQVTRKAPIFIHGYDYMQPRPAAAYLLGTQFIGRGPWLHPLMKSAGLSDKDMRAAADAVVDELHNRLLNDIALRRENVFLINQRGLLTPGEPQTTGDSHDWLDEIHPNPDGFEKLARERWELPLAKALWWNPQMGETRPSMAAKNLSTALGAGDTPAA